MPPAIKALSSFFFVLVFRRTRYVPRGQALNSPPSAQVPVPVVTFGAAIARLGINGISANILIIKNVETVFFIKHLYRSDNGRGG
jgi:hypothetical protein